MTVKKRRYRDCSPRFAEPRASAGVSGLHLTHPHDIPGTELTTCGGLASAITGFPSVASLPTGRLPAFPYAAVWPKIGQETCRLPNQETMLVGRD